MDLPSPALVTRSSGKSAPPTSGASKRHPTYSERHCKWSRADRIATRANCFHRLAAAFRAWPKVILIGMDANEEQFMTPVRIGVAGYLLKDAAAFEVVSAVRSVFQGQGTNRKTVCLKRDEDQHVAA